MSTPITLTRDSWTAIAADANANAAIIEVEVICSDPTSTAAVSCRVTDVDGLVKPAWQDVLRRVYDS